MNKYSELVKLGTKYATRMNRLRSRIFGDPIRVTSSQSMKVVAMLSEKPMHLRDDVINYYPRHNETSLLMRRLRHYGLFRDEFEDFKDEMERQRRLKGKARRYTQEEWTKERIARRSRTKD